MAELHGRGRSRLTVSRYAHTWAAFERWMGEAGIAHPFDATLTEMQAFATRPAHHRGHPNHPRAAASIKNDVNALRSFYRWAFENEHTRKNKALALHGPKVQNRNPKPVPLESWQRIVESNLDDSLRLALYLGYFAGLRRHEILALAPEQVNAKTITDVLRKGGDDDHTIPWLEMYELLQVCVPEVCVGEEYPELMERYAKSESHWLIPWGDEHYGPHMDSMNKRMTSLSRRLHIPQVTPHMLRHSCATNLASTTIDPKALMYYLNHSDMNVTMRYVKMSGGLAAKMARDIMREHRERRG